MKLNRTALEAPAQWLEKGYKMPAFSRDAVTAATREKPTWIHFGAGNIFRAFPAAVLQNLLDRGLTDRGLIVAEGFDPEIIEKAYRPMDNLSLNVTLKAGGSMDKTVTASIVESLTALPGTGDWQRLLEIFGAPSLQMASFTITEKGYNLQNQQGQWYPDVTADFAGGPENPVSYMGKLTALCHHRYRAGKLPLALVSMDNCSQNGARLQRAVTTMAGQWAQRGLAEAGFENYLRDCVTFPWSMIDKITPRPDDKVKAMLQADGLEDLDPIVTGKHTYVAPFVNGEETQYLVIEDAFPNGRPPLEQGGVIFTDRETVEKVERMKVSTCLNPLHTAMALYGCLLGYRRISDEMADPELLALIRRVGYTEGLPVVTDPGILNPREFLDTVVKVRFVNPYMPDTPQRIATDSSQKLAVRFGQTLKAYLASPTLKVSDLVAMPLVFAGFCRYHLAVDDVGNDMELSPDPQRPAMEASLRGVKLGDRGPFHEVLWPILSNAAIFGVDLYEARLGNRVEELFAQLVAGPGAVRQTLRRYLTEA
ncbi:MAG: mannitol dehydrogenase family protein [Faecousia sp.]